MSPTLQILTGDAATMLKTLPDASVHCCVTSPPYYGLRDYGVEGQIGLEDTPDAFVAKLVEVFREVKRVLRDDGTLWLNLGDSYASGGRGGGMAGERGGKQRSNEGALLGPKRAPVGWKDKDLLGIPWMVAFALRADGWWLRQDIIWHKPSVMPESVTDRCTKSHEYIFLLSKSQKYYFDNESIKEPSAYPDDDRVGAAYTHHKSHPTEKVNGIRPNYLDGGRGAYPKRNKRSVWSVSTTNFSEAHFATYPPKLIEPCIIAGSPVGGTVLDCFGGSGTTGMVALELGRGAILIELNPEYVKLIAQRTNVTPGLALS